MGTDVWEKDVGWAEQDGAVGMGKDGGGIVSGCCEELGVRSCHARDWCGDGEATASFLLDYLLDYLMDYSPTKE